MTASLPRLRDIEEDYMESTLQIQRNSSLVDVGGESYLWLYSYLTTLTVAK
jgi:hypothetical protein